MLPRVSEAKTDEAAPASPADEAPVAPPPAPSGDATLLVYRILTGVLLVALIGAWVFFDRLYEKQARTIAALEQKVAVLSAPPAPRAAPPPEAQEPDIDVTDVGARLAEIARQYPDRSDYSETYYGSAAASVHMHVMGDEQTSPLHIHRKANEATVIVDGVAEVTHVFGKDGALVTRQGRFPPGSLIASPPFCGHRWFNPSKTQKLGNLVFTLPRFDGNLYVQPDDARLQKGGEPFLYDPARDLEEIAAGAEPNKRRALPILGGRMSVLAIKSTARIEHPAGKPVVTYVLRGAGVLDNGHAYPVKERHLAVINRGPAVTARAEGGPMALLVFEPESPPKTEAP
jgi:hypothetical protein